MSRPVGARSQPADKSGRPFKGELQDLTLEAAIKEAPERRRGRGATVTAGGSGGLGPLPPVIILTVSLVLTGVVWWAVRTQADRLADVRFAAIATDVVASVNKRMRDYEQVLRGGVAFLNAQGGDIGDAVTAAQWRTYVASLRVEEEYPGIQGIGLSLRVEPDRGDGGREAHSIVFLEPLDRRNRVALGYDMFSEPTRRSAMARARDTGLPALSGKVTLMQEITADVQGGALLYLPVYRDGGEAGVPKTVEGRREALAGFVYSPFRMGDLMQGIVGEQLDDVAVRLHDGFEAPENLLFGPPEIPQSAFVHRAAIDVFGRRWLIDVAARPDLQAVLVSRYPLVVLVAGLIISVLLWWLSRSVLAERRRRLALSRANVDLAQARAEAEAAGRSKSKFLAAASHDIRQPVQSLVLLAGALSRRLVNHPAHLYVTQIEQSLDALRLLLDGLLDISRLDAGVVEPKVQAFPIGDMLTRLHQDYAPRAGEKGLRLRIAPCSVWVSSDPALLERILRNLIENAVRYTRTGGILVGCRRAGDALRVEVHDTGIGIAPAHRSAIFDEFYQVGNPERDRDKGLGLGLAIVRRLAGLLDHRLDVRSIVGRGTCFSLDVPVVEPPTVLPADAVGLEPVPGLSRRLTVLVIDDEELVRKALCLMLADWGCETLEAADADGAAAALEQARRPPDVVVADYRLRNHRTGLEAIQRVQAVLGNAVPGVILTGDTAPERIAEASRSGHAILHKPVNPRDLQQVIERLAAA